MVNNSWYVMTNCTSKLDNLSNKEAALIGRSLSAALEDRAVAESGVDMWINDYPSLVELSKRNKFFTPMALTIGQRKLAQAPWGLAVKVGIGAVFSLLNIATDAYTIWMFFDRGVKSFAYATIGMVAFSMIGQLAIIYVQNMNRGWRVLVRELLIVLTFFKPVVIAFKVISGVKADDQHIFEPYMELMVLKLSEM